MTSIDSRVGWFCEERGVRTGRGARADGVARRLQHARRIGEKAAQHGWQAI